MSPKVDFTTLEVRSGVIQEGENALDLSDGKWIIFAYCTILVYGAEKSLQLRKNGTIVREAFFGNTPSSIWSGVCLFDVVDKTSSDKFYLQADISSVPETRSRWIAIRLGTATIAS